MPTDAQKWYISLTRVVSIIILFSPLAFAMTNTALKFLYSPTCFKGCPNLWGILLHAFIFLFLDRYAISEMFQ